MNVALIPTLLIAAVLFAIGSACVRRANGHKLVILWVVGVVAAVPGVVFALYYFKIFGEPIWLYTLRSLPFSELTASGAGFFAGLLDGKLALNEKFRRIAGRPFFAGMLALSLIVPYLKPVVLRPRWSEFQNRWSGDVCLQTSESSCGPACAATLLKRRGQSMTEVEIARSSFTSRTGTENWYLARTLRNRGMDVRFIFQTNLAEPWPYPAIAGVRLPHSDNSGHFITILDRRGDHYIVGDPIEGEINLPQAEFLRRYTFTGFFMTVK